MGGAGAEGKIIISWSAVTSTVTVKLQKSSSITTPSWSDVASGTIVNAGTSSSTTRVRLSSFTPENGYYYQIVTLTSNGALTYDVYNAKIILTQTGTITKLEPQYLLANTLFPAGTSMQKFLTTFNPTTSEWQGVTNSYSLQVSSADGSSSDVEIKDSADTTIYATVSNPDNYGTSSVSSPPVSSTTLDVKATTNNSDLYAAAILVTVVTDADAASGTYPDWQPPDKCISDKCLFFNGSADIVEVSNADEIDFDMQLAAGFTFSFWIKANSDGGTSTGEIFWKGDNSYARITNEGSDGLADLEVKLDLTVTDESMSFVNAVTLNTWQHILIGYTDDADDEATVYINGAAVTADTDANADGSPETDGNNLLIAGSSSTNFHGFIDDFKIYRYQRSAAQALTDAKRGGAVEGSSYVFGGKDYSFVNQGLLGYWKLDESQSTDDAADSSGNSLTLTNNGSTAFVNGKFYHGSEHIPASTQYFAAGSTINNIKTVSFWVNPDNDTNYYINLTTTANIQSSTGTITVNGFTDETVYVNAEETDSISANAWSLVTVTDTTAINADTFYLGRISSSYFDGTFDDVRLYNRTLSSTEIQNLYNWSPDTAAWWPMDEATGTVIYDTSGNGNTSSAFSGNVAWTEGRYGTGLVFDGIDDVVRVAEGTSIDLGATTDSYTVSGWIKTGTYFAANAAVLAKDDGSGAYPFSLYLNSSNYACFAVSDGTPVSTCGSTALNDNGWHHLSAVRDISSTKIYLYVDGILVNSANDTTSGSIANDDDVSIGNSGTSYTNNDFTGSIDDVRIYSYSRTSGQIIEDLNAGHPPPGSPVGSSLVHLKFNEGYGDTAYNSGTGNYTGNLGGATTCPQAGDSACPVWTNDGKFGRALDFEDSAATDDYVDVGDINELDGASTFTASAWVNMESQTTYHTVLGKVNSSTNKITMQVGSGGDGGGSDDVYLVVANGSSTFGYSTGNILSTGIWNHWTMVYDGTEPAANRRRLKFFLNGTRVNLSYSGTIPATAGTNSNSAVIGAETSTTSFFDGKIDEVKIFTSALTADQVKVLYNQSSATVMSGTGTDSSGEKTFSAQNEYCPPGTGSSCTAPVGEWKLDENTGTGSDAVKDTSGNGFDGTPTNIEEDDWSQGKTGQALTLDGSNEYVDIGTGPSSVKSVEFWVKPATTTEYFINLTADTDYIWANGASGITAAGFASPKIYLNGYLTSGATEVTPDAWNHIIVTDSTAENASNLDIGRTQDAYYLEGIIDHVRLYSNELTQAQVSWLYNRGAPLAYWKFNDCQGSTAYDASGNGYNGTITPQSLGNTAAGNCDSGTTTEMWDDGTNGKRNASLGFDGSDDYVNVSNDTKLTFNSSSQDFSIFAWVKRATSNTDDYIISKEDGVDNGWTMFIDSANDQVTCSVDATNISSSTAITDTNWHHVGCTIDREGNGQVYIDGHPDGSAVSASGITMTNSGDIKIGSRAYSQTDTYFDGQIDDLRIFNYALTKQQVNTVLNDGAVNFAPLTGTP